MDQLVLITYHLEMFTFIVLAVLVIVFAVKLRNLRTRLDDQFDCMNVRFDQIERKLSLGKTIEAPEIESSEPMPEETETPPVFIEPLPAEPTFEITAVKSTEPEALERFFSNLRKKVVTYFKTGNTVVKVGVIILFFGVSFLVKFAAERGLFPPEARLIGAALGGLALLHFGWRLRNKAKNYALVLQGGGVGVLFITTFATLRIFHLIPAGLAFVILAALAGFTAWMAVLQDSRPLAAFGIVGGFLAPLLASTGQGNHVILFGFYAVLNIGIFAVAWFKAWRILNLLGFIFTFVIGTTWGVLKYQPENFSTVEPFLILFFLIYVFIPILFAKKQAPQLKGYVDGTLVFGNTIMAFGLQTQLVKSMEFACAFSALALSIFYLCLGKYLYSRKDPHTRMLVESFVALGVVFATLTIPLALDGHWTAAVWAMEAAGIYWISVRQERLPGRIFSSFLVLASGIAFLFHHQKGALPYPFLNSFYLGCVFVAAGALLTSYVGWRFKDKLTASERGLPPFFFIFGNLWWIVGGFIEIESHLPEWWHRLYGGSAGFPYDYLDHLFLLLIALGTLKSFWYARRLKWAYLDFFNHTFVLFMAFVALLSAFRHTHPFAFGGLFIWPSAFALYYLALRRHEVSLPEHPSLLKAGHACVLWMLTIIGSWEFVWQIGELAPQGGAWGPAAVGVFPMTIISLILFHKDRIRWPIRKYWNDYAVVGAGPVVGALWLWVLVTIFISDGNPRPLPYLPVINPLELVQICFLLLLPLWFVQTKRFWSENTDFKANTARVALGIMYFLWLNGVLMRSLHHFAKIPFQFDPLFSSVLVQASISIYWSLIGIVLMILASKKRMRWLWIVGAVVMGVVVSKLFLIDLSKTGTVARIVSFLSVGILLLVVGYLSPIPPKLENERVEASS